MVQEYSVPASSTEQNEQVKVTNEGVLVLPPTCVRVSRMVPGTPPNPIRRTG
jgi:hypothetical protein